MRIHHTTVSFVGRGPRARSLRGFTLVELVVTIVIVSVLALGISDFIDNSVAGFVTTSGSNQLASAGRTAMDRMGLEIGNALPNSAREAANQQCLEFIPLAHATTYLDPGFSSAAQEFDVVNFYPELPTPLPAPVYAAIYPLDASEAYTLASPGPLALIDSITDSDSLDGKLRIHLAAEQLFPRRSPLERLFITNQPVSFCLTGTKLYRYSDYAFQANAMSCAPACLPPAISGQRSLIADNLAPSPDAFRVQSPTLQRNGIVLIDLNFSQQGTTIALQNQVLMRNAP